MMSLIYNTSDELVRDLKTSLRSYKKAIKDNTTSGKRFPFVEIPKCVPLNDFVHKLTSNLSSDDIKFNAYTDHKISKICRKYFPEFNGSTEEKSVEEPPQKRIKIANSLLDLNLISDQNEDLDFEEENIRSIETNGEDNSKIISEPKRKNGFRHKTDYQKTNGLNDSSQKNGIKENAIKENGILAFNNLNTNNSFKIPKKSSHSIESIISQAQSLSQSKRPVDAYNHLNRYINGAEQWQREDVLELLLTIAKNTVDTNDFVANVSKFNELMDKIKSLKYIDDDFWDQIIFAVEKKRSDSKNTHQINQFLSNLHDYMVDNKIAARIVCAEAVVIAYRILTNHPSAKDLIDLND